MGGNESGREKMGNGEKKAKPACFSDHTTFPYPEGC